MKFLLISLFLLLQSVFLSAQELNKKPAIIFASGNLKFVFPQMIKNFYSTYPDARVYIQYSSSGSLTSSIFEGKQYDIFFSANLRYPQKVYQAKKSATKPKIYAQGLLILFIQSNPILSKKKLEILRSKEIKKITIANASSAPYGAAALEVLKNIKCCQESHAKIQDSSDAATAIDSVIWEGNAGFLSKSALYMIPEHKKQEGVDWIDIDETLYSPIIQAYVISEDGLKNDNAIKFLHFIESPTGQKIFQENGYKSIK